MDALHNLQFFVATQGAAFGLEILGATLAWFVGRRLIAFATSLLRRGMLRSGRLDPGVGTYLAAIAEYVLTLLLVLSILGIFGIQTTSFAALLAGLGLAIGTAWGGLLAHFAAGLFLQVLRPFKLGDFVTAGAVTGTVSEIGVFTTKITTPENVETMVPNNKIFSDTIQNYSSLPYRRVDCTAKIAHEVDPVDAIERLRAAVATVPNVMASPPPEIEILSFTAEGPLLAVRPFAHTDDYWQVLFDTNRAIASAFGGAGYPIPHTPVAYTERPPIDRQS